MDERDAIAAWWPHFSEPNWMASSLTERLGPDTGWRLLREIGRDTRTRASEVRMTDAVSVVLAFNEAINGRDIAALAGLMTETHRFIDSDGVTVDGSNASVEA